MVFEILTDELKHAHKYDYILYLNPKSNIYSSANYNKSLIPPDKKSFTLEEAKAISTLLGIDFPKEKFDLEQFKTGLNVELEHGRKSPLTNITNDNPVITGMIALAHLTEFPDYYDRITKLENEAKAYWANKNNIYRPMKEFTLAELGKYNGLMGNPAYIAINGIVYDVSTVPAWSGGKHSGLQAGKDLSTEFQNCHGLEIIQNLPKVGILNV